MTPPKPSEPIELERLDELMKTVGKKIVQGIAISIARDEVYDTQPLEDWLKEQTLEWMKSLVPDKQDEMDGCDPSTDDRDIRWAIAYEKGYNACIDDILTRLNSNQSVGENKL